MKYEASLVRQTYALPSLAELWTLDAQITCGRQVEIKYASVLTLLMREKRIMDLAYVAEPHDLAQTNVFDDGKRAIVTSKFKAVKCLPVTRM